jgi:hypothetical protein
MSSGQTRSNKVQSLRLRRIEDKVKTVVSRAITSKLVTYCKWLSASVGRLLRPE